VRFTRTAGGATVAPETFLTAEQALEQEGDDWVRAVEESELLGAMGQDHDQERFLAHETTPVLFGSAVLNFGVRQLLDVLLELAPPAGPREDVDGVARKVDAPFSAFVFKVQAGMDSNHRDRLAYMRVCSGVFERGSVVTHSSTGKPFATKYAQQVFGRDRETVDLAYPGDVVGLVNANALRVGDSLYVADKVAFPPIPSFAPEHFAVCRAKDSSKYKQFRRGIEQLEQEGVVQVLRSDLRGDQAPVLAAVGPMQFEVAEARMAGEFSAPVTLDRLPYQLARRTSREWVPQLDPQSGVECLLRGDGTWLALFADPWRLSRVQRDLPDALLEPLVAAADTPY
jgi:peptide chain release factor 3